MPSGMSRIKVTDGEKVHGNRGAFYASRLHTARSSDHGSLASRVRRVLSDVGIRVVRELTPYHRLLDAVHLRKAQFI